MGGILAASRGFRGEGRKAAGDNALQVGTIDRHGMHRRAMDFAAFLAGILGTVIVLRHVHVVGCNAVVVTTHLLGVVFCREIHTRVAVKTRGVGCGKQTRLKSRHDQEYDRQHCSERYVSQDRDSTNIRHRALGTIVRLICQVRVRKVCCNATKSERHCLLRRVCISISHQTQHRSGDNQITRNLRQGDDRDEAP